MKVLVCGGRDYLDYITVDKVLSKLVEDPDDFTIVQGGAKGADFLAKVWCYCYLHGWAGIKCEEFPADWKRYGKAARHIRNQQMLDEGKPDLVVAFPGGRDTADMVLKAKKAGVEVKEVK